MKIDDTRVGKEKDRRIKLTPEDKEAIKKLHLEGSGIRELARKYKVDKRLIQFVIYPDRQKKNIEDRARRGGWSQYYDKNKWSIAMREHREYKRKLLKEKKGGDINET